MYIDLTVPSITRTHLDALFSTGGILILTAAGDLLVVGRRVLPGERFLASADAVWAFYQSVGSVDEAASALSMALAGTPSGALL